MYKHIIRSILVPIFFLNLTSNTYSQDLHFTNYMITPTHFNPAQTGHFLGTVRGGFIFRDQWEFNRSTTGTPFRTFGISVDMPVIYGFKKNHWIGAGITMMNDQVGITQANQERTPSDLTQKWTRFAPSLAYHIGLDKKLQSVFTIGVQYAGTTFAYGGSDIITHRWLTNQPLVDRTQFQNSQGQDVSGNYGSINAGVMYKTILNKVDSWELGVAMMHIQGPKFGVLGNQNAQSNVSIKQRINIHTLYRRTVNKKLVLEPALFASLMGGTSNIEGQLRSEFKPNVKKDFALIMGAGYRIGDAPQFLTGARWGDWLVSLSYDYSLTDVSEVSPHSLELGVRRVFTISKKPETKPVLFCPRL